MFCESSNCTASLRTLLLGAAEEDPADGFFLVLKNSWVFFPHQTGSAVDPLGCVEPMEIQAVFNCAREGERL